MTAETAKPVQAQIGSAAVLGVLRSAAGPLRIAEIADRVGAHPNTVRFHLRTLIGRRQAIEVEVLPTGPGRPAKLFRAVPRMDPNGPRDYRMLAEILLADSVASKADRARHAGFAWGMRIADSRAGGSDSEPQDRIVELMAELGFSPIRGKSPKTQIELRNCPFLELVEPGPDQPVQTRQQAAAICSIHLGLLQGVLAGWQAPVTADRLEPFAEPDSCLIHLAERSA